MKDGRIPIKLSEEDDSVQRDRASVYGDHHIGNTNLGRAWSALLTQHLGTHVPDIPADVVDLMMVMVKCMRAAIPSGRLNVDTYVDGRVYFMLAEVSAALLNEGENNETIDGK